MKRSNIALVWVRLAVVYLLCGMGLGVYMGASGNHSLFPVHAHMNLLGWVSMALFAWVYDRWPALAANRLGAAHFWLYNLALPVLLLGLMALLRGAAWLEPLVGALSVVLLLAAGLFALNLFRNARAGD
ncbi:MAG: hypothetical protein U1F22_09955 [Lysobacterales bacterium]